jgi:hypothetical protein
MRYVVHTPGKPTRTGRSPDHMRSEQSEARGICPETGDVIEIQEVDKKIVVKRFLQGSKNLPHPLDKYKAIKVKNMTPKQIESAYNIIKGIRRCRIL